MKRTIWLSIISISILSCGKNQSGSQVADLPRYDRDHFNYEIRNKLLDERNTITENDLHLGEVWQCKNKQAWRGGNTVKDVYIAFRKEPYPPKHIRLFSAKSNGEIPIPQDSSIAEFNEAGFLIVDWYKGRDGCRRSSMTGFRSRQDASQPTLIYETSQVVKDICNPRQADPSAIDREYDAAAYGECTLL